MTLFGDSGDFCRVLLSPPDQYPKTLISRRLGRIGALPPGLSGIGSRWEPEFEALCLSHTVNPPTSVFVSGSAMLLFLAMPMLSVGGILFLMTNLQVEACPHPRHLAGGWGGMRTAKHLSTSAASVGGWPEPGWWLWVEGGLGIMMAWHRLGAHCFHEYVGDSGWSSVL